MALFLFFLQLALLFTSLASGKPILIPRLAPTSPQDGASSLFDVVIESLGNTTVEARVTNVGPDTLRVIRRGGILDPLPTRKVVVNGTESDPTFIGVNINFANSRLSSDAFIELAPKQTISSTFDIYDSYDLTPSTTYTATAKGVLAYTALNDTAKFHHYRYISNSLPITTTDSNEPPNRLHERSTLTSCTDEETQIVEAAIARAGKMATVAAADARTGSDLFQKFFKSTSEADMTEVADRLDAIAEEATTTGKLTYYCEPTSSDYCGSNIAALTYPYNDRVVNCPGYYESTPENNYCGYLDQAGISLHEFSHANAVYNPGTDDVVYGYEGVLALNTEQALRSADTFAYYASAVYLNCAADDSVLIGTPTTDIPDNTDTDTGTTSTEPPITTTAPQNPIPTTTNGIPNTGTDDDDDNTNGWDQGPTPTHGGGQDGPTHTGGWGPGFPPSQAMGTSLTTPGATTGTGTGDWKMSEFMNWLITTLRNRYGNYQGTEQAADVQVVEETPCEE